MQRATLLIGLCLLAAPLDAFGQVPTQAARNRARTLLAQSSPHGPPGAPSPADGTVVVRPKGAAASDEDADFEARKRTAKFSFEFSKAEVVDIVKAISDMTRQNFIIPERVKGQRITILSPTKITASEAYQVFHTALAANGISIVRSGRFYKLLDAKEAIKDTVPTCVDEDGQSECALFSEQMVTALMRLRHVDAAQINTVARSLLSKDGDISIFQPSNALIISEYAPNLKRVRRIIDALDVPGFDAELRLVQIQYSSATEISEKLTQVFDVSAQNRAGQSPMVGRHGGPGAPGMSSSGGGKEDDNDVQISKIIPDDRTNQIIIKANRRSFDAIRHLVAKLDVPIAEGEQGRVHVYYLENAKAEDLASTLSSLAQGTPAAKKGMPQIPGGPGIVPGGGQRPQGPETTTLFEGEVKITADKATNSLLVMASAHDYRSVRSIVEKLDMPRRQVYVEAAILEVNLKDDEQFGLNFHDPLKFGKGDLGPLPADGTFGFLQSVQTGSAPSPTFTALTSGASLLQAAGGAVGGIIGKGFNVPVGTNGEFVTLPSFGILLKWLTTTSNANILSTPHILTTDNEQAKIEVGEKIPFNSGILGSLGGLGALAGGSTSGASSSASALGGLGALGGIGGGLGATQIQRIDVSLKLTLTPQINERNKIRLEIEQVVEDVTGKEQASQTPTTSHRSIKTVVVVDDQQTIVLGGLVKDSTTESESKIPLLGDLPILGWLFKQHSTKMSKTNLMLILTPYIISSADDFQRIFERKMQEHEEFAAEYYGHRKEFRAHVDYKKKSGPLGRIVSTLRRERIKFENGGDGDGSESLIAPQRPQTKPSDMAPGDPAANTHGHAPGLHSEGHPAQEGPAGSDQTGSPGLSVSPDGGMTGLPPTSGPISEAESGSDAAPSAEGAP